MYYFSIGYFITITYGALFVFIAFLLVKMSQPLEKPLETILRRPSSKFFGRGEAMQILDKIREDLQIEEDDYNPN